MIRVTQRPGKIGLSTLSQVTAVGSAAIALWLVTVPPEVTLVLIVLAFVAVLLLSPLWIPALLAFMAYKLIRTRVTLR